MEDVAITLDAQIPGYENFALIGKGGMGAVWRATQTSLARNVAIKILHSHLLKGQSNVAIERFIREARAVASLSHPNIIQIFDVGRSDDIFYYVMEFVEGEDLDVLVKSNGPFAPDKALNIIYQATQALHEAHDKNIIHRDIKPGNILLTNKGVAKITDLGLAKNLREETGLTKQGTVLGSPKYMAPEQISDPEKVDERSDIYSLGVTLYTIVTGQAPFDGEGTLQVFAKIFYGNFISPEEIQPSLPPAYTEFIKKMMHLDPQQRYQDTQEILSDVLRLTRRLGATKRMLLGIGGITKQRKAIKQADLNEVTACDLETVEQRIAPAPISSTACNMMPVKPQEISDEMTLCDVATQKCLVKNLVVCIDDQEMKLGDTSTALPAQLSQNIQSKITNNYIYISLVEKHPSGVLADKIIGEFWVFNNSEMHFEFNIEINYEGLFSCCINDSKHKALPFVYRGTETVSVSWS